MDRRIAAVIDIDDEKCVNCHACIAACPVKYCIDGSGDKVRILHELCIGCGACIAACTHHARKGRDDIAAFLADLAKGVKMVAVVAPAVAAHFPTDFLRLNGWLRRSGIEAVFDVAFGAELTVRSYLEHIRAENPPLVIAQPCPAVVSYIEIYQPELLPRLAPADSPMLHTMKMIKEFYPAYRDHRIAVVSPCVSKRREFDETGLGDYNVTIERLVEHLEKTKTALADYPEVDFEGPLAERAVLFSSPGGLKATVEREAGGGSVAIRKIEGPEVLYRYLESLPQALAKGVQPRILDCLNCEKGCNGGTGTGAMEMGLDELEARIESRRRVQVERLGGSSRLRRGSASAIKKSVASRWKPGLYGRTYVDRSSDLTFRMPSKGELEGIYRDMRKTREEDFLNCAACGYGSCEKMAVAIFNRLNRAENCHRYQTEAIRESRKELVDLSKRLDEAIGEAESSLARLTRALPEMEARSTEDFAAIEEASAAIEQMLSLMRRSSDLSHEKEGAIAGLLASVGEGSDSLERSLKSIRATQDGMGGIDDMVQQISKISSQTNLLSMNAAIEAAHAGDAGRGFAVVAEEIRRLANQAATSSQGIGKTLKGLARGIGEADYLSERSGAVIGGILKEVEATGAGLSEIFHLLEEISAGSVEIGTALSNIRKSAGQTHERYRDVGEALARVEREVRAISSISRENVASASGG